MPACSTRQVLSDGLPLLGPSLPPQVATRPEGVVKVTCSVLESGKAGGEQVEEAG